MTTIPLEVVRHVRVDGTVDVFSARDDDGCSMLIAVDPRYGNAIRAELEEGRPVPVAVEPWQIIGQDYSE